MIKPFKRSKTSAFWSNNIRNLGRRDPLTTAIAEIVRKVISITTNIAIAAAILLSSPFVVINSKELTRKYNFDPE